MYRGNSIKGSNPFVSALTSVALAKEVFFLKERFLQQIVYILLCNDGSYYTGCTQNLEERLIRHQKGYVDSTKNKLPVDLVFYCTFTNPTKAFEFEEYLKTGSGIAFRNKHLI